MFPDKVRAWGSVPGEAGSQARGPRRTESPGGAVGPLLLQRLETELHPSPQPGVKEPTCVSFPTHQHLSRGPDIWGRSFWWGRPVPCRVVSSIPGLHPQGNASFDKSRCIQTLSDVPAGRLALVEKHWVEEGVCIPGCSQVEWGGPGEPGGRIEMLHFPQRRLLALTRFTFQSSSCWTAHRSSPATPALRPALHLLAGSCGSCGGGGGLPEWILDVSAFRGTGSFLWLCLGVWLGLLREDAWAHRRLLSPLNVVSCMWARPLFLR